MTRPLPVWMLLALLPASALGAPPAADATVATQERAEAPQALVISVYDGDTMTLENGDKVRLRWVNTPELKPHEPFSDEARAFTERMVHRQVVTLDPSPDGRDGYGRLVAGVSTPEGDLSLGLLEAGLAHVFVIPPDPTDIAPLLAAQERARAARRGIWTTEAYQAPLHITSFHANAPGPDEDNVNGEYLRVANVGPGPVDLTGWAVRTRATNQVLPLPSLVVPAGHTVKVLAGVGLLQADPARQLVVHLGSAVPVYADEGETVELVDPSGRGVDRRTHKGG
ncbi:MAG: thermonuclease family protein [Alphaproteobacteria bacterium]|nr:thermonuclease family protein [Alphaproteobacteria bacterium]